MTRTIFRRYLTVLPVFLAAIALTSCNAGQDQGDGSGQDGEHSFAGKTVTVVIGLDASAGGTTVATNIRSEDMVAGLCQRHHHVSPAVGQLGKAVQ